MQRTPSRKSRLKTALRWLRWQLPYITFCYAYFPITLVKRILLRPKRAYLGLDPMVRRFWDKWGFLSKELCAVGKRSSPVWISMISGGEVLISRGLLQRLNVREHPYLLSTESYDSFTFLRKEYGDQLFFPPWDTGLPVQRSLKKLNPRTVIFVLNAYFPILLQRARRWGAKTVLINALMSRNVEKENPAMRRALAFEFYRELDAIFVQGEADYQAFRKLGVPKERLAITGDISADLDHLRLDEAERDRWRNQLGIKASDRVMMVGSTHPGEIDILLETFLTLRRRVPECRVILAPRWLHEVPTIALRLSQTGLKVVRRTELLRATAGNGVSAYDVLILDTFGELGKLYGVADVAYIGASLVPINKRRAGHNILEVLAHGIPPLFGPHMNLWRSTVQQMLEVWPGLQVDSPATLAEKAALVLNGHAPLAAIRQSAAQIIESKKGALDRTITFLKDRGFLF